MDLATYVSTMNIILVLSILYSTVFKRDKDAGYMTYVDYNWVEEVHLFFIYIMYRPHSFFSFKE